MHVHHSAPAGHLDSLLADLIHHFVYLKLGLALVLV
jgi:hypothetical protein